MKKLLPNFFLFFLFFSSSAQITIPVIKANFGVEGNLKTNLFTSGLITSSDDWFSDGSSLSGASMIDTFGAASIVANYFINPATRMQTFSKTMRPSFYSIVNKRLVIDAVFHRDFHGNDSTVFATGSNKNAMSPSLWNCPVTQNIPDKNDILDAFVHVRRDGRTVYDSLWMFGGLSIENTNGNRYFDFELYQTDISYNKSIRKFEGYGADAGHTSWTFDAFGNVITAGDIIFSAEYGSSSLTLIEARIWINKNSLTVNPVNFSWGGNFDGDGAAATFGYASIIPKSSGVFYTGLQSPIGTSAGPFALVQQNNNVVSNYIEGQFMEFSVNLSKLGVDPGSYSNNPCGTPFRRVLIKSRSSTSFTSELKDFVAPFKLFDYPPVNAFTNFLYFCEFFPPTPIEVINPNDASLYTWTTNNGNIVGTNIGTTVIVDAPGTYYVTQQLNSECPMFSIDSVTIFFDSECRTLDVNISNFKAIKNETDIELNWQVDNNNEAAFFEIEYSWNNSDFINLGKIRAIAESEEANYSFKSILPESPTSMLYYRIKVFGKNGLTKISNSIALSIQQHTNTSIFPNPFYEDLWFSVDASKKQEAKVQIWDMQGKLLNNYVIQLTKGRNILKMNSIAQFKPGMYLVKVQMLNETFVKRILKN